MSAISSQQSFSHVQLPRRCARATQGERTAKAFLCANFVGAHLSNVHFNKYRLHGCNSLLPLIVTAPTKISGDQISTHGERTTKAFLCAKIVGAYPPKVHCFNYRLHGCNSLLPLIVTAPSKTSGDQFSTPGGRLAKAALCAKIVGAHLSKVHFFQLSFAQLQSSVPADRHCALENFRGSVFNGWRATGEGTPMRML